MKSYSVKYDPYAIDRLDIVIECLLIGLLAFMPLAFGAVEPWSEMVVFLAVAAMSFCLVLRHWLRRDSRIVWTWAYLPVLILTLVVVFQLIPLPNDWVTKLSPETLTTKTTLLSDQAGDPSLASTTLSFYPYATKHDLRLILAAAGVFFIVVNVYRRSCQIKRLLAAVAVIGFGFAFLALLQVLTSTPYIYWTVETPNSGVATAGSFVNHSHYAQFMNLSIGAALALMLVRMTEAARGRHRNSRDDSDESKGPDVGWIMAMIVLGGITIFTSLSRNGVISMVSAATLTGVLVARRRRLRWRGWMLGVLPLVAFACLLFVGFDAVYERLATVKKVEHDWRWQMTECTLDAWSHYPIWGTGMGTHEFVFPMFDTATIRSLAARADNDYAQWIEETGLIGAVLLGSFLVVIVWHYGRLVWRGRSSLSMAAFGLGFGLLAILIHSATDFGQHLPANFCLSAVACGLLVAVARRERNIDGMTVEDVRPASWLTRRLVVSLVLFGLVGGWGWVLWEANASRLAERYWNEVAGLENALQRDKWQGSDDDFVTLIRDAADASDAEPDNVKRRYWLNLYRWYSISRTVNPETGLVELPSDAIPAVERITDELSQARILCPTYGPVYAIEGQLRLFFLKQPKGGDLIRKGFQLASYDAPTCFVAGSLAAEEGDLETAGARFRRAIELDGAFYREVMPIYIDKLNRPDLFREMAGDDPGRVLALAKALSAMEKHATMVDRLRADAFAILKERCESSDPKAGDFALLASLCQEKGDFTAAVDYYRRALALDYRQVGWRMNLARSLAALNQWNDAIHEARICLRLRPQMKAAENLIKKWSVQQAK